MAIDRELVARVGLCAACRHKRVIRNDRGSAFYFCERSREDRRFPKYPPLPVAECDGWEMPKVEEEKQGVDE